MQRGGSVPQRASAGPHVLTCSSIMKTHAQIAFLKKLPVRTG